MLARYAPGVAALQITSVEATAISSQKMKSVTRSPASAAPIAAPAYRSAAGSSARRSWLSAKSAPPPAINAKTIANSRDSLSTANGARSMPRKCTLQWTPSATFQISIREIAGAARASAARGQPRSGASSTAATMRTNPGWLIIVVVVPSLEKEAERFGGQDENRAGQKAVERVPGEKPFYR